MAKTQRQLQKEHEARQREKGLDRLVAWVPARDKKDLKKQLDEITKEYLEGKRSDEKQAY